mmetsp:Transcript_150307/g.483030  ORF Transcript_150307/g.483030 Transcript_150307/m.483030 type:complete len:210 (-) Transcript_150307:451-1080(-)
MVVAMDAVAVAICTVALSAAVAVGLAVAVAVTVACIVLVPAEVIHATQEDCEDKRHAPQPLDLRICVRRQDLHRLDTLLIGQVVRVGISNGLSQVERQRQAHDVVFGLHGLLVPQLLKLGVLTIQHADLVPQRVSCPLQHELSREGDGQDQKGMPWTGAEEINLLEGAPSIDGCETCDVCEQSSEALDVGLCPVKASWFLAEDATHPSQ